MATKLKLKKAGYDFFNENDEVQLLNVSHMPEAKLVIWQDPRLSGYAASGFMLQNKDAALALIETLSNWVQSDG